MPQPTIAAMHYDVR